MSYLDDRVIIKAFPIDSLLPKNAGVDYYYYNGSLTTPGCQEIVSWIIDRKLQKISQAQVQNICKTFLINLIKLYFYVWEIFLFSFLG